MKNPPEYKAFRLATLIAYGAIAGFLCTCLLVGGYLGARARMGEAPELAPLASVNAQTLSGCVTDLEHLQAELKSRLDATLQSTPARRSSAEWEDWSPGWRQRTLAVGARCRLPRGDVPGSLDVKIAYERLLALHRHFTTMAVQFSKEIGPHSDGLQRAMEKARQSVQQLAAPAGAVPGPATPSPQ